MDLKRLACELLRNITHAAEPGAAVENYSEEVVIVLRGLVRGFIEEYVADRPPQVVALRSRGTIHAIAIDKIVRWSVVYGGSIWTTVHLVGGAHVEVEGDYDATLKEAFKHKPI